MGPATHQKVAGKGLDVKFPGNRGSVSCYLAHLSLVPGGYSDPAFEETLAARREELIEKSKGVYGIQKELGDGVECGTDEVPLGWGMTFPHDEPITEPEEDVDADKSGNVVLRF